MPYTGLSFKQTSNVDEVDMPSFTPAEDGSKSYRNSACTRSLIEGAHNTNKDRLLLSTALKSDGKSRRELPYTDLSFKRAPDVDEDGLPSKTVLKSDGKSKRNLPNRSSLIERALEGGWRSGGYSPYTPSSFFQIPGFDEDGLPSN